MRAHGNEWMQRANQSICLVDYSYYKSHWHPSSGAGAAHRIAAAETCPKPMTGEIGATRITTGHSTVNTDAIIKCW